MKTIADSSIKIQSISIMRVVAMFMIIFFHSFFFYSGNWWALGGVSVPKWNRVAALLDIIDLPMFMYISGYLFGYLFIYKEKYRDRYTFIISKAKRLLLPYLIWGIFQIIIMPYIFDWKSIFTGSGHLWFLLALFGIFVIVILFADLLFFKTSKRSFIVLLLSCIVVFVLFHLLSIHHSFLCIHSLLYYLPSFVIGIFFARFIDMCTISTIYTLMVLIVALFLLGCYIYSDIEQNYIFSYICRLVLGWSIIISSHVLLSKIYFSDTSTYYLVISHFDKHSMGVYIFHQIVINVFLQIHGVRSYLNSYYDVGPFAIFIVGFLGAWLLSYLFLHNKYLKWAIG